MGVVWAGGFAAAALGGHGAAGCISDDPNHCRHRGGDSACGTSTPYCDECLSSEQNGGCVGQIPDGSCHFAGDDPFVAGTGTTTGQPDPSTGDDVGDESTTAVGDCTAEGERDDACPSSEPFCSGGACMGCEALGGDGFCGDLADTPVCGPAGDCVECTADNTAQCTRGTATFCGLDGTCSGCYEHSQCGTAGCDLYEGVCLSERSVFYLSSPLCDAMENHAGTAADPHCNMQTLVDALDPQSTVHIDAAVPFDQQPLVASSKGDVLIVIGEDDGSTEVGVVQAAGQGRVYTQNLRLQADGASVVGCNTGGRIWLRDTDVVGNGSPTGVGVGAGSNCEVTVERGIITDNAGGGVSATNAEVRLWSSGVLANGAGDATSGITLDLSELVLVHTTVIENGTDVDGHNLACDGGSGVDIRNSVLLRDGGASFDGCGTAVLANSVVDDEALADPDAGVTVAQFMPTYFVDATGGDPRLTAGAPFDDVAVWAANDPYVDIEGDALDAVVGATNDAGCDQR
ncbi:MAG: hypothetical protein AAF721_40850 [Myxococcota bacterium]